jgi:hypothetical protein
MNREPAENEKQTQDSAGDADPRSNLLFAAAE